ncbi:type III pantothenate kinase [Novosphingobium sp.]|uniref:type III pantothenate kinase n=1 Tax=Novosphingobium sp. TaxID=1874826 RepID=UPI003D0FCAA8
MLLAIDVGNTNVVFALIDGRAILGRWRIATDPRRTADEYAVWLLQLLQFQGYSPAQVTRVIVSTVVPRALHNIQVLSNKYFHHDAWIAGNAPVEWDMRIDIEQPRSLGADRAVNAIAAHARFAGDLVVVDFGTATTFDVIDADGTYKGGIIAPGINLSLEALVNAAARLPRIAIEPPRNNGSVIGRNTEDAMHIGVFWGYVAMMEGLIARMRTEIGRPVTVVATGGLAVLFHDHTTIFDHVETDLTIEGLALLAERVKD